MREKKGISLIVLVITVIVMIILAGAVLITMNNMGILRQAEGAVEETNKQEVQQLVSLLWAEAFTAGKETETEIYNHIIAGLVENDINADEYAVVVTDMGARAIHLPEEYRGGQIASIEDGVPIPKGFVASSVAGENKKDTGLVIYEGTTAVTSANVETARRTRNQYVWVPVADFKDFVRQQHGTSDVLSSTLGTNYWELVIDTTTNMPLTTQSTSYVTSATLAEAQAMYESVKKYGGFYVARYETGIDTAKTSDDGVLASKIYSVMGKIPYNFVRWTQNKNNAQDTNGAVQLARNVYPTSNTNYGAVSTLIYGVQWDRTLAWWLETKAKDGDGNIVTDLKSSKTYGNTSDCEIAAGDLNDGAKYATRSGSDISAFQAATATSTKASGTYWLLSTGALKAAKVNNIYDMAGNLYELTMEGNATYSRVARGGSFIGAGASRPVVYRSPINANAANYYNGFRVALYIKDAI